LPRARLFTIRGSFLLGALASLGSFVVVGQGRIGAAVIGDVRLTAADSGRAGSGLSDVALPGGLRAALAAIRDYNPPDRSQFLLEVIRRVHNLATGPEGSRDPTLLALLAHLDAASAAGAGASETLPLPLTPSIWTTSVFGGRGTAATLTSDILRSRGASLFYLGLLSVDAETRAFLASKPELVTELSSRLAAGFVLASPGLHVAGTQVSAPGGERAARAWEALVGRRLDEPVEFIRALLGQDEHRVAWFLGSLGQLTPGQLERVLDLEASETQRAAALRRLYAVFVHLAGDWRLDGRTFWRPAIDPSLLALWLPADADGRPVLPATREFWQAVFADAPVPAVLRRGVRGEALDFVWLAEQVFAGASTDHKRRLHQVLFASRLAPPATPRQIADTAESVRAAGRYPALVAVLERLRVTDASVIAQAARRAADLASLDGPRAVRALTQFQGLLAVIVRASARGGLEPTAAQDLVRSLAAVERSRRGDYDGRLVEWLAAHLAPPAVLPATPLEPALVKLVAGTPIDGARIVDWEGSRYRVDLAAAETRRIERLLGDDARPWFSSAHALVSLAGALSDPVRSGAARDDAARALADVARAVGWTDAEPDRRQIDTVARFKTLAPSLARKPRGATANPESADRAADALRSLADDLLARGLLELTYAIALGQSDRAWITADEAAAGHDFGLNPATTHRDGAPWRRAVAGADQRREWRATGSLLGLEVSFADLGLMRLSTRLPPRRPTINEEDRHAIVETVALVEPAAITDADRDRVAAAIARGRARLAAASTPAEAAALAGEIRLSATRQTLLEWTAERDPARLTASFSPLELFWLGLGRGGAGHAPPGAITFEAWGVSAEAATGCLCLRLPVQQPWEMLAGRWGSGLFASAFPDLSLRLAELLAALRMPSELLAAVLSPAALDLANSAVVRGQDDRRGLVEFVQALTPARVEQYLALLTTGGALVPLEGGEDVTASKPGAPR
jgi:hypothetical protein